MPADVMILAAEAMTVYFLVLWAHSLRHRFGLAHFYALIGGLTAIMSWVTDANISVEYGGITFMVGSTVFFTSLLLSVFVVYVFDGPHATRIAISTIAGVSIMVPLVSAALHFQMRLTHQVGMTYVPVPDLRTNVASVAATIADLFFLAIAWEFWGKPGLNLRLWSRAFMTLLGVMWLDNLMFDTGAFAGRPDYAAILQGDLISRLVISAFASPFLYGYLYWQNRRMGAVIENRPVLAILREVAEVRLELNQARAEIVRRQALERELERLAHSDGLTQIANRRYLDIVMEREWKRAERAHNGFSLIMCDIDYFKRYNDTYGHVAGDDCLRKVAQAISTTLRRPADFAARYGGEEFVVLLPDTDLNGALAVANQIRDAVAALQIAHEDGLSDGALTVSQGVASIVPTPVTSVLDLLDRADQALLRAKNAGRNCILN